MTEKIDKPRKEDSVCDIGRVFTVKIVLLILEEYLLKDSAGDIGRVFTCTLKIVLMILEEFTLNVVLMVLEVYLL